MTDVFPKLKILTGPEEGQDIPLGAQPVPIGRSETGGVSLSDTSVSRHHCVVLPKEGGFAVKDDRSRNGTYLEDERLPEGAEVKLSHLDVIRIGLYEMRYLEREAGEADLREKDLRKPKISPPPPLPVDEPEDILPTDLQELEALPVRELDEPDTKANRTLLTAFVIGVIVIVGLVVSFFIYQQKNRTHLSLDDLADIPETPAGLSLPPFEQKSPETLVKEKQILEQSKTKTTERSLPVEADPGLLKSMTFDPQKASVPEYSVILDVKTEPMAAVIYLGDKRLGVSPLKQAIMVQAGQEYEVYADFELRDINDIYRKKVTFRPRPDGDVVELVIDGDIGTLKIQKLPKRVEFYLEGYYVYDTTKSQPVKMHDISYGRPIYLPYGKYLVELRERSRVSGSENEISQVRFQREYVIDKENHLIEMAVNDKDLQFFPVVIHSTPNHAQVHYGGDILGKTPYTGTLPIGANKLRLTKEGYFDALLDIDMRMNSAYETTVELKTSKIGELINSAKEFVRDERMPDAIQALTEALKFGGSSSEKAEAYYLLGDLFLKQDDTTQARPYFEKARVEPLFAAKAALGLAQVLVAEKNNTSAMHAVVEVMLNFTAQTPDEVKTLANAVFKKISPLKSVIFVMTEPPGASVYVNDKKVDQASPVILSELGLGNYRLEFQKPGYQPYKTSKNLKIGEFAPIFVKLVPDQL